MSEDQQPTNDAPERHPFRAHTPLCSVIMPVYNTKEEYLRAAIESILTQSYTHFELLIVDDCSMPYVREVISSYTDARIRYHRLKKNSGAAAARNHAIDQAQGEFIAFLDSDDVAMQDRLEKQLAFFAAHPQVGCLGSAVLTIGDDASKAAPLIADSRESIETALLFFGCVLCQSSVMLRKSILDARGIRYDSAYVPAEDYKLWIDLIGHTTFAMIPKALTCYRAHRFNISHRQHALQNEKCGMIQVYALENICGIQIRHKTLFQKFFSSQSFTTDELQELQEALPLLMRTLAAKGYPEAYLFYCFRKKLKKVFYKTRTYSGQWTLFRSRLNRFFKLPLPWRIFCLLTRAVMKPEFEPHAANEQR